MAFYEESRWLQRYQNFKRALAHLDDAMNQARERGVSEFSDLEKQGLVKCFEIAFDLAWKTLKDYLVEQGYPDVMGPHSVIKQAFTDGLIVDGNEWVRMLESRNDSAHTYDETIIEEIIESFSKNYYILFDQLDRKLTALKNA